MQALLCQIASPADLSPPGCGSLQAGANPALAALPAACGSVQCSGSPSMGARTCRRAGFVGLEGSCKDVFICLFFLK